MGFADRLEQARAAQEKQSGPTTAAEGNKMILNALTHAVETNRLQQLYTPPKIASQARALSQILDFDPFCQKYSIAPLIAADLLQVNNVRNGSFLLVCFPHRVQLSLYDVVLFIDDSGSMLEGSKWRDLQAIVQQIVEMTTQFDTDGIQVTGNLPPAAAGFICLRKVTFCYCFVVLAAANGCNSSAPFISDTFYE